MDWFALLLIVLATWRVTRLLTDDFITEPVRDWLDARSTYVGYLMSCTYCAGTYIAALFAWVAWEVGAVEQVDHAWLLWPALGATTVFIQKLDEIGND